MPGARGRWLSYMARPRPARGRDADAADRYTSRAPAGRGHGHRMVEDQPLSWLRQPAPSLSTPYAVPEDRSCYGRTTGSVPDLADRFGILAGESASLSR